MRENLFHCTPYVARLMLVYKSKNINSIPEAKLSQVALINSGSLER